MKRIIEWFKANWFVVLMIVIIIAVVVYFKNNKNSINPLTKQQAPPGENIFPQCAEDVTALQGAKTHTKMRCEKLGVTANTTGSSTSAPLQQSGTVTLVCPHGDMQHAVDNTCDLEILKSKGWTVKM